METDEQDPEEHNISLKEAKAMRERRKMACGGSNDGICKDVPQVRLLSRRFSGGFFFKRVCFTYTSM